MSFRNYAIPAEYLSTIMPSTSGGGSEIADDSGANRQSYSEFLKSGTFTLGAKK